MKNVFVVFFFLVFVFLFFCLPKNQTVVCIMFLLMFSFVNCILIRDEQKLFVIYFFVFFVPFFFQHVNCTFYGTQKIKFSSVCLKLKYLTELKVYFPDIKDQNELVASDEHLCL